MRSHSLQALLDAAARSNPSRGLLISAHGDTYSFTKISYTELLNQARKYSRVLQLIEGFQQAKPILLHLQDQDHANTFIWFWAVLFADAIPVLAAPFSDIPEQRQRHIGALAELLESPICITSKQLLHLFHGQDKLNVQTIESLSSSGKDASVLPSAPLKGRKNDDLAILMLTSGSTGAPKAVRLSHNQICSAVASKVSSRDLPEGKPFLNWIGLDHVASITEIHLTAMYLGVDQLHLYASDIIAQPLRFLALLSEYHVTRTFGPNFFFAKLVAAIRSEQGPACLQDLDLSHLAWLGSGGEANDVELCATLSRQLAERGAPSNVIVPGFGMTETCAGSIYNLECPEYDLRNHKAFTSLGKCISGVEMRVTTTSTNQSPSRAEKNQEGNLEMRGPPIFDGYYRNPEATAETFTSDGWFKTGDQAFIDSQGNLSMIGRSKETLNVNGVKHPLQDIEHLLEQALTSRTSRVVCFPHRPHGTYTEHPYIMYASSKGPVDEHQLVEINDTIVKLVMLHIRVRPTILGLEDESLLPKTTLGKVSRAKLRTMVEAGHFADQSKTQNAIIQNFRQQSVPSEATEAERLLLEDFSVTLGLDPSTWGLETPIFEMGVTSIDLIRLKQRVGHRLSVDIPITTLLLNPTTRSMASALSDLSTPKTYDPVVPLRREGSKTPLWLVHPGTGEVLVFLGLCQYIEDRPIYALRARGFDGHDPYFTSIDEAVTTYHVAIRKTQPKGPYAIAGYSFGAMLAFEIAKRLEQDNREEVRFLGSFNLPPHIKWRMKQLGWIACLLHLCYFLDLMSESHSSSLEAELRQEDIAREVAMSAVLSNASEARMAELSLTAEGLANWADLTHNLHSTAIDYDPSGAVKRMDVFYANPLSAAARSKEEWLDVHLSKWRDFAWTKPVFHEVGGAHYTMLSPEHIEGFAKTLKMVLEARNV